MIGKITPKEKAIRVEENLKAIFGDSAGDVKDASLKANPSLSVQLSGSLYAKAAKMSGRKKTSGDDIKPRRAREREFNRKAEKLRTDFLTRLNTLTKGKRAPVFTTFTVWKY